MSAPQWMIVAAAVFGIGVWLMLPRGTDRGRTIGLVLVVAGLAIAGAQLPAIGGWLENGVFGILAAATVISGVGTITFRNPVYCAISFGATLLSTAGLFLFQGAQFLGLATVVVYAGAILVTFLFVLMLANPSGRAFYDRIGWEPRLAALGAAALFGAIGFTLVGTFQPGASSRDLEAAESASRAPAPEVPDGASPAELAEEILAEEHVARLGAQLYGPHLLAVEVAGVLLLVALVGATAIISQQVPHGEEQGGPRP